MYSPNSARPTYPPVLTRSVYSPASGHSIPITEVFQQHDTRDPPRPEPRPSSTVAPPPPSVHPTSYLDALRVFLLVWAFLRLVVSALWTALIAVGSFAHLLSPGSNENSDPNRLIFGSGCILLQLVEFGMIVAFIIAGVKKNTSLYRAYYRYSILTLITYVIALTLNYTLNPDIGHFFVDIYITYHVRVFTRVEYEFVIFCGAAILDICLEIFLIVSIKGLINKYSNEK